MDLQGCCSHVFRTPPHRRSLKTQLFCSFGLGALIFLSAVVITSCYVVYYSGKKLIDRSQHLMFDQVENRLSSSAELFAVAGRAAYGEESLQILVESVRDRIVGYPHMEGWEDGVYSPFVGEQPPQQRMHPWKKAPVPLDFEVPPQHQGLEEEKHSLDERRRKHPTTILSTETASYKSVSGLLETDGIYQATGDLSVVFKAIYESFFELLMIEVVFFPTGNSLQYPSMAVSSDTNNNNTFVAAEGCDWLTQLSNPYTGKKYANESPCPKAGKMVKKKHPLERDIIRKTMEMTSSQFSGTTGNNTTTIPSSVFPPNDFQTKRRYQVNHPLLHWDGPSVSSIDNETPVFTLSKAIFDRVTNEWIGVAIFEILESRLSEELQRRVLDDDSDVYMVYTDPERPESPSNGLIVGTTPNAEHKPFQRLPEFEDIREHFQTTFYDRIPECASSSTTTTFSDEESSLFFNRTENGGFIVAVPVPPPPKNPCDNPNYKTISFVVQKIGPNVFVSFHIFAERVRQDVQQNIIIIIVLGAVGLGVILLILAVVSKILTQPLEWITIVARKVIGNDQTTETTMRSRRKQFEKKRQSLSTSSRQMIVEEDSEKIGMHQEDHQNDSKTPMPDLEANGSSIRDEEETNKEGFVNFDYQPNAEYTKSAFCTLSTELQQLLEAFQSMIHGFSGDRVSKVAEPSFCEIKNKVRWHSDFAELYNPGIPQVEVGPFRKLRQVSNVTRDSTGGSVETSGYRDSSSRNSERPSFRSSIRKEGSESFADGSSSPKRIVPEPVKINWKSTLGPPKLDPKPLLRDDETSCEKFKTASHSKLFWSIVVLMALPIFLTNCVIGAIVGSSLVIALPKAWKESARQGSKNIEMDAMQLITDRKAAIMANRLDGPARDVYLMARITNWLLFDGIPRSRSITKMDSRAEECKQGPCPLTPQCDCDTLQNNETECGQGIDPRFLQQQWFEVQKIDSNSVTGNRDSSQSFPSRLFSSETTEWWSNSSELPGAQVEGSYGSGYDTLHDRVAVASASAALNLPIYNYARGLRKETTLFGGYLAFANDGLVLGWSGCDDWHARFSKFVSTYDNGASLIDDELCANGKYGYDPRCRNWYFMGRDDYLRNQAPIHVTPPYKLDLRDRIAQTITAPITNPKTGEYVGQVGLDFHRDYESVLKMLDGESSLTFMITPREDILGGDMVVNPGSETGWASAKIEDYLFANEADNRNRDYFSQEILSRMKNGERGNSRFYVTREDYSQEEICLYYAPVKVSVAFGLEPDDFASGPNVMEQVVYSVATGKPCDEVKGPYYGVEDTVNDDMMHQQRIFTAIVAALTIAFVVFSFVAATYIAFPMIQLSRIIINAQKGEYDSIPPLKGGCKEVQGVYNTFSKLNKIVKISNASFFSGNLSMAHHFETDALLLYRKINDRKAIGVTCNNLANTLFAIQYENIDEVHCCSSTEACFIPQALDLYHESVTHSQNDFEAADGDLKVEYAIQLADRIFNRGLYFLFIDGYECAPEDARECGYSDITYSRNLHYDIRETLLEKKQMFSNVASYFSRLVRRINCLAAFYDDIGLREIWDAQALLDEAKQLLRAAIETCSRGRSCPLFDEVTKAGRQQQLDGLETLLAMNSGDILRAAKTGMRMIVEDAYLLESAFVSVAEALLLIMKDDSSEVHEISLSKWSIECTREDLRAMVKSCKKESLEVGKNCVFVFDLKPTDWPGEESGEVLEELNYQCLKLYDSIIRAQDQIGIVGNNMIDSATVDIGSKEDNVGRQRAFLDVATSISPTVNSADDSTASLEDARFPIALQMLLESSMSLQFDSYILWITDGSDSHNSQTLRSLWDQIERFNQERSYEIHVIIIRLQLTDDEGHAVAGIDGNECELEGDEYNREDINIKVEDFEKLSKHSVCLSASSKDDIQLVFELTSGILSTNHTSNEFISFLTMEKF